eukprot:m.29650 g.29650  ORF g.29650 m.29650 type:complete len:397 (-) comp12131_c0_seq1:279-1469(-)
MDPGSHHLLTSTDTHKDAASPKRDGTLVPGGKPSLPMRQMVEEAIQATGKEWVSVGEICGNLMGKYPYYATHPAGSWRSSVRTTLTSGTFAQTDRDSTGVGKGVLWGITANPVDHGGAPRKKPRRVGVVEADSDVGAMSVWKQVVAPDGHGAGVGEATSSTSSEPRLLGDTTQNNSWCSRVGCTASAALIRCTTCTLSWHNSCLSPPIVIRREGCWRCNLCRGELGEESAEASVKGRHEQRLILRCHICGRGYKSRHADFLKHVDGHGTQELAVPDLGPRSASAAVDPAFSPKAVHQLAQSLRECIKFLLPPNWSMSEEEIDLLSVVGLTHFPVTDFLEHYRTQMQAVGTNDPLSGPALFLPHVWSPLVSTLFPQHMCSLVAVCHVPCLRREKSGG